MKMEAAGPFNAPVNPVALGIPVTLTFKQSCLFYYFFHYASKSQNCSKIEAFMLI